MIHPDAVIALRHRHVQHVWAKHIFKRCSQTQRYRAISLKYLVEDVDPLDEYRDKRAEVTAALLPAAAACNPSVLNERATCGAPLVHRDLSEWFCPDKECAIVLLQGRTGQAGALECRRWQAS